MKKEINLLKINSRENLFFKIKKNKLKNEIYSRKKKKNNLNKRI